MKSNFDEIGKYTTKIILFFVVALVTFAVAMRELSFGWSDFSAHMTYAVNFRREFLKLFNSVSDFPHQILYPLWHIPVNIAYKLSRLIFGEMLGPEYSAAIVTALVNGLVFLVTEIILASYQCRGSEFIAFGLSFVMPYVIPRWHDKIFYFGQSSPVIWHNPTNMIVKIFALIGFFLVIRILRIMDEKKTPSRKDYLLLTAVVFLSVIAKPSFFQGFVPALGIYVIIHLIRTKFTAFRNYCLLCACFVPAFFIILFQYFLSFYLGENGEGIGIGWLNVANKFYPNPWVHLLLALFFPVCYMVFNPVKVLRSLEIRLSVLYLICAWLEFALFYEKGIRMYDGNFEWALCLAFAVLWLSVSISFFRDWQNMDLSKTVVRVKNSFLFVFWLLHIVFGTIFLYNLFTAPKLYF